MQLYDHHPLFFILFFSLLSPSFPCLGGTLRIFGETLNKDVPYRTLLLSTRDTAASVVQEILEKYGRDKSEASNYCLVQVVVPHGSTETNAPSDPSVGIREVILDDSSCPLAIEKQHLRSTGALSFHVKLRKKKKKYIKSDFEVNTDEIRERLHSLNPTNPTSNDARVSTSASSTVPADLVSDAVQAHNKLNSVGCNFNGGNAECSERSASTNSGYGPTDESAALPANSPSSLSVPDGLPSPSPSSSAALNTLLLNNSVNVTSHPSYGQEHHSLPPESNHTNRTNYYTCYPHDLQASQMVPPPSSLVPGSVVKGPQTVCYILQKGNGGMGLSIVATKGIGQEKLGIYIKTVVKGGAADLVSQPTTNFLSLSLFLSARTESFSLSLTHLLAHCLSPSLSLSLSLSFCLPPSCLASSPHPERYIFPSTHPSLTVMT